jgi:hypothetical protein
VERSSALPKTKQRAVMRICASCARRLDRLKPRRATGIGRPGPSSTSLRDAMPKAKERASDFGARLTELRKAAGYTQVELAAALDASADELLGIKPIKKGKKPDTQLHRRLQRIEKLDSKAKRQITQLLDTFIEREELKQRVNAQGA